MKLSQLLAALPRYNPLDVSTHGETEPNLSIDITNITSDSRHVEPGSLFVAYPGANVDLHRFIPEAIAGGATAIVGEDGTSIAPPLLPTSYSLLHTPYFILPTSYSLLPVIIVPNGREALAYLASAWHNFPAQKLTIVGVTGTDGKTTTINFLYHILKRARKNIEYIQYYRESLCHVKTTSRN